MEALLIIGALAAGAHYLQDDGYPDGAIHSSQTTQNISKFHRDVEHANMLANVETQRSTIDVQRCGLRPFLQN